MRKTGWWSVGVLAAVLLVAAGCSDRGSEAPEPQAGLLTAAPPSATVGQGDTVRVAISGGTPPYAIAAAPNASLASAVLADPSLEPATLVITAVTVASVSGSTSVRVTDSSPAPGRAVTVPITRNP
jgi:hypothetical protein